MSDGQRVIKNRYYRAGFLCGLGFTTAAGVICFIASPSGSSLALRLSLLLGFPGVYSLILYNFLFRPKLVLEESTLTVVQSVGSDTVAWKEIVEARFVNGMMLELRGGGRIDVDAFRYSAFLPPIERYNLAVLTEIRERAGLSRPTLNDV